MIVRNKKNGTNVLAFGGKRITVRGGETIDIPDLTDISQVINKADFESRGWFEIIENKTTSVKKETNLEKAKKEVKEYTEKKKSKED